MTKVNARSFLISRALPENLRDVEELAHVARAKANGASIHAVNQTIGALRCWCYVRPRQKSVAARLLALTNADICARKLRAFIVTGHIAA